MRRIKGHRKRRRSHEIDDLTKHSHYWHNSCGGVSTGSGATLELSSLAARTHSQKVKLIKTDNNGLYFDLNSQTWVRKIPSLDDRGVSTGGTISWHQRRSSLEKSGNYHAFYTQHYLPPAGWAGLAMELIQQGIPMVGGEIAIHSRSDGVIFAAGGAYYPDVSLVLTPTIKTADTAMSRAISEALLGGHRLIPYEKLSEDRKAEISAGAGLELHPLKSGQWAFGLVWRLFCPLVDGGNLRLRLDAESGELLDSWDGMSSFGDPCNPEGHDERDARAVPLNPGIPIHEDAKVTTNSGGYFDAHQEANESRITPEIIVYKGDFKSSGCPQKAYRIIEYIQSDAIGPIYDSTDEEEQETFRAAGDALVYATKAFSVFKDLDFEGPDGNFFAVASMTVSANTGLGQGAAWSDPSFGGNRDLVPPGGVWFSPKKPDDPALGEYYPLQFAAAQDIVAHEWGHSALASTIGWSDENVPEGATSLKEGWADVLGMGVEWAVQDRTPDLSHPLPGKADWMSGEDTNMVFRRTDSVAGVLEPLMMPFVSTYSDERYTDFNFLSYHRSDIADDLDEHYEPHYEGEKASVVFYLMSEGSANPGRPDLLQDRHVDVKTAFSYLGRMLLQYTTSADGWGDLGENLTMLDNGMQLRAPEGGSRHLIHPIVDPDRGYCIPGPDLSDAALAGLQAFRNIGYPSHTGTCQGD